MNGTQLAAGCADGTVVVWSYPSGDVLFEEKKHSDLVGLIAWNPFKQDVLATREGKWVRNVMSICAQFPPIFFFFCFLPNCDEMSPEADRHLFPLLLRLHCPVDHRLCVPSFLFFYFSSFQFRENELLFWNSRRENGDAEKANHFLTMQRHVLTWSVAWISANQIAIGLQYGGIEIWEMDDDEGTSRVVKLFIHGDYVSRKEGRRP